MHVYQRVRFLDGKSHLGTGSQANCKWVFNVKENPDSSVDKYKTSLFAQKFSQLLVLTVKRLLLLLPVMKLVGLY